MSFDPEIFPSELTADMTHPSWRLPRLNPRAEMSCLVLSDCEGYPGIGLDRVLHEDVHAAVFCILALLALLFVMDQVLPTTGRPFCGHQPNPGSTPVNFTQLKHLCSSPKVHLHAVNLCE